MRERRNKVYHFLARHAPKRFIYWAGITMGAYATTGEYSNTVVPDLYMTDAIQRWAEGHKLREGSDSS